MAAKKIGVVIPKEKGVGTFHLVSTSNGVLQPPAHQVRGCGRKATIEGHEGASFEAVLPGDGSLGHTQEEQGEGGEEAGDAKHPPTVPVARVKGDHVAPHGHTAKHYEAQEG